MPRQHKPPPVTWSSSPSVTALQPARPSAAMPPPPPALRPRGAGAVQRAAAAASSSSAAASGTSKKLPYPPDAEAKSNYRDMSSEGYGTASHFRDFSAPQRALIIAHNRKKNGGKLKSDASNDPHSDLVEAGGSENSAEIDHVVPKLSGGSNHYLNARVISWKLNNSEERNVSYDKKSWHA